MEKNNNPVSKPAHYTSGKIEVIDFIDDQLSLEGVRGFCIANAIKYLARCDKKDPSKEVEDLEKAKWYIDYYIKRKGRESAKNGQ